jgi:hypothetical protein
MRSVWTISIAWAAITASIAVYAAVDFTVRLARATILSSHRTRLSFTFQVGLIRL